MKKINIYLMCSLFASTIIFTPLITPVLNSMAMDTTVNVLNHAKQNNSSSYKVNFNETETQLSALSTKTQNNQKINASAINAMQKVVSFKDNNNNIYNVLQNVGLGLDVYQTNNGKTGKLISTLSFDSLKSSDSTGAPLYPDNITDVVASSDGQYLYLATPYGKKVYKSGVLQPYDYFSIIWKYNIHTSELKPLINTKKLKWTVGGVPITSVSAIGVIPSDIGDKLLIIDDYRNSYYGLNKNDRYLLPYVIFDVNNPTNNLGEGVFNTQVFTGSGPAANRVNLADFFITEIDKNKYKLVTSSRSKEGGNYKNQMYVNEINFTLNSKNVMSFDYANNKNCYTSEVFGNGDSNNSYKAANLDYDWFNYLTTYPKHFINSWYDLHPIDNIVVISNVIDIIDTKTLQQGSNFGITSNAQPYTWLPDNLIESDTSLDGQIVYYLSLNSHIINYTKGSTSSPTNKISIASMIDNDYQIPGIDQDIVGFGWADQAKSKMMIYDTHNDVLQYDVTTEKMKLINGLAFKTTNLGGPQYKKPSDLTKNDLNSLFIDNGLNQEGDKISVNTTNVNDQTNSFTLNVAITKKNGDVYKGSQNYDNFNQPKPKVTTSNKTISTDSWIIIGVVVGVVVLLIAMVIFIAVRFKKKLKKRTH